MAYTDPRTWVTAEIVTAAIMNTHIRDNLDAVITSGAVTAESWTPALEATTTDPLVESVTGRKWRVGPLQFVWVTFVATGGFTSSGTFFVTLPVASFGVSTGGNGTGQSIGTWQSRDESTTANNENGSANLASTTTVRFSRPIGVDVTDSSPFVWGGPDAGGAGDVLSFTACYPVA